MGFNSGFKGLNKTTKFGYTYRIISYRAVNTLRLGYKNQSVNAV